MRAVVPVIAAICLAALPLGCGSSGAPAAAPAASVPAVITVSPDAYVARVEEALKPPGRLAAYLSDVARRGGAPTGRGADVDRLVARAREHLEALRAMRLASPALDRQRAAFTGAYGAVVTHMERVAAALGRGDPGEVANTTKPFFASLRGLSSALSPSS